MKDILKFFTFAGLFLVPFLTLYVESDYFFPFITGKNFWFRILVDVTFVTWFTLALLDAKYRPRASWILIALGGWLTVIFTSSMLGFNPENSFFSNFERMDGFISLLHMSMYVLVLGSMLTTRKHWLWFLNTSLLVAFMVSLKGLSQFSDGVGRVDSTLGNAAYMAVYMLFHIFFSFWMFVEAENKMLKTVYGFLAVVFIFLLIETGTRGTALGLGAGIVVMASYISLFGEKSSIYKKYATWLLVFLVIAVSVFVLGRNTEFVQNNSNLSRIANISLSDLKVRGMIWQIAWKGIKERPVLGYGHGNFSYVFDKYYDPRLYAQEQWFDRTHNVFLDWLIAGGFVGLFSYLAIFIACIYYLVFLPLKSKDDTSFTVLERGVLLGILAGYFTHNLVVFDNIISYTFFAVILALIHSRVGKESRLFGRIKTDSIVVKQVVFPVSLALLVFVIYKVYVPQMATASGIIETFKAQDPSTKLEIFNKLLGNNSYLGRQEVVEQLVQQAVPIINNKQIPENIRQQYLATVEEQLKSLLAKNPDSARLNLFLGDFYRTTGAYGKAEEQLKITREKSPRKQTIIYVQGFVALTKNDYATAKQYFKEAFELDKTNLQARKYYLLTALYTDDKSLVGELVKADDYVTQEQIDNSLAQDNNLYRVAGQRGDYDLVIKIMKSRLYTKSDKQTQWRLDKNNWITLALAYQRSGKNDEAVATLTEAKEVIKSFSKDADCYINNINKGIKNMTAVCKE